MPRTCTVCAHPERAAIDAALLDPGQSLRDVASRHGLSVSAAHRHKRDHLPAELAQAQAAADVARADNIMEQLQRCFERTNLLYDACDRWLRDASDPSRYDIGARAEDIDVTYYEDGPKGRPAKHKAKLSALLRKAGERRGKGFEIELVETKHADPRDLVLKTAARLQAQTELLAKLLGELADGPQVNVLVNPEWLEVRAVLVRALTPWPEARAAVAAALVEMESNGGAGA